jgi:SAM-dependent methyltransferase
MIDYFYKLLRKSLSKSLYSFISSSEIGRGGNWRKPETFFHIFDKYQNSLKGNIEDKVVLEIGSGDQFFTAFCFLEAGAKTVILTEPKLDKSEQNLKSCFNAFKNTNRYFRLQYEQVCENILSFSDLSSIPAIFSDKIDFICSHQVLEHFESLETYFEALVNFLRKDGIAYNSVDLSDHTYHVLEKYRLTHNISQQRKLYHLRYSIKTFAKINDNKCYMNRILLPEYLAIAHKYKLNSEVIGKRLLEKPEKNIHQDILDKFNYSKANLNVTHFEIIFNK